MNNKALSEGGGTKEQFDDGRGHIEQEAIED